MDHGQNISITMVANMHAVLIFGGDECDMNHERFWGGKMMYLGVFFMLNPAVVSAKARNDSFYAFL